MRVYVAAALRDDEAARAVYAELRARGHEVTYPWAEAEDYGTEWNDAKRRAVADLEVGGVVRADLVVALLPGGRGTHVEIGAALATNTPVMLCYRDPPKFSLFYSHGLCKWHAGHDPVGIVDKINWAAGLGGE